MQLAVPIAVNAAVRIDTFNCITVFHVSFFILVFLKILTLSPSHFLTLSPSPSLNREGRGGSILRHQDS